jgi:hypothetical protein
MVRQACFSLSLDSKLEGVAIVTELVHPCRQCRSVRARRLMLLRTTSRRQYST